MGGGRDVVPVVLLGLCSVHTGGFLGGLLLIPWDGEPNPALGSAVVNPE